MIKLSVWKLWVFCDKKGLLIIRKLAVQSCNFENKKGLINCEEIQRIIVHLKLQTAYYVIYIVSVLAMALPENLVRNYKKFQVIYKILCEFFQYFFPIWWISGAKWTSYLPQRRPIRQDSFRFDSFPLWSWTIIHSSHGLYNGIQEEGQISMFFFVRRRTNKWCFRNVNWRNL